MSEAIESAIKRMIDGAIADGKLTAAERKRIDELLGKIARGEVVVTD